jgi:hypothetical protein
LPPLEVGVDWKDGARFVLIHRQALGQSKIGGRARDIFTYGFDGLHSDAYLNGLRSEHVGKERRPVFYLYVPDGSSSSDYSLMKMNKKGNRAGMQRLV